MRRGALLVLAALLAGCGGDDAKPARDGSPARTTGGAARHALCAVLHVTRLGRITHGNVSELSGLTGGRAGRLFAIEDSGNSATLIAMRGDGAVSGRPVVTGARNVDWEDIAARRGALFVADIGDNATTRDAVQVYRVPEPAPGAAATAPATTITLRYPDIPHDAETLIVDPLHDDLLIVTKGLLDARIYHRRVGSGTLRKGPRLGFGLVTAGAISADGKTVALRSYDTLAVWQRRGREPLTRTLSRDPCTSPTSLAAEGQGEALALQHGGRTALTAPEGERPVLRRYAPR